MNDSPSTPPLSDLSLLAESAHLAEKILNSWLQAKSWRDPSIEEINQATRALWRLTSVRKTLLQLSVQSEAVKPREPPVITDEQMEQLIRDCDRMGSDIIDDDFDDYDPLHPNPARLKDEPSTAPPAEPPAQRSFLTPRVTSVPACPSIPCIPGLVARLIFEPISRLIRREVERKRVWQGAGPKKHAGGPALRALYWPTTKPRAFAASRDGPKECAGGPTLRRALFWPDALPAALSAGRSAFAWPTLNIPRPLHPHPPHPLPSRAPT